MRAPVPQPLRSSSSGLATACRRADAGAGEDPAGGADALVVPGEVALPDGVLVERRRERGAGPGHDRAAHAAVSGARGLGVMPRRYVAGSADAASSLAAVSGEDDCRWTGAASSRPPSRRPSFQAIASRIDGRSPTSREVETQPVGGGQQPRAVDEQRRVVQARGAGRRAAARARCTLISTDSRVAASASRTQRAARAQQPGALGQHRDVVVDVLEDLAGHARRRRSRRPAAPRAPSRRTGSIPCSRASAQAGQPEVDADVPVAERARRAAPSARRRRRGRRGRAARAGRRDVLGPRGGQPVQRANSPVRLATTRRPAPSYWAGSLRRRPSAIMEPRPRCGARSRSRHHDRR